MKKTEVFLLAIFTLVLFWGLSVRAENGEIAKATQYWENRATQGMTEKAIATLETLLKTEPNYYEALWKLGCYYQYLGDISFGKSRMDAYKKGLFYTQRAIRVKGQVASGHLWHALLIGSILLEKPEFNSSKLSNQMAAELQLVLHLEPQNALAHLTLARYCDGVFGRGSLYDKKKAQQEAGLALKYAPEIPNGWLVLGGIAQENNDFITAKTAYARFLDGNDPFKNYSGLIRQENQVSDYESLWHLGYFYEFMGQNCPDKKIKIMLLEKGLVFLDRAKKTNPGGVAGHLYRAILLGNIGLEKGILSSLGMVKPMVDELQTVVALEPGNAMAHAMLGQIYWRAPGKPISVGNKQKALDETALAVKYDPNSIAYWFNYGKIAVDNKNYNLARMAFTKVMGFFGGAPSFKNEAQQELIKLSRV
ncbi:MAG TPA: hypothetical protein DDW50_15275 [Firmicutes bacterium]|jgi:tetratricopeptide (TPR) repeat protein|nr:hypothetical protein [Bacillota bacterium]